MIADIRMLSQQLTCPAFGHPKDLVTWMGAIQAQDYAMSKWAVGTRLQAPTLQAVEEALKHGEILRTHVMRPTWHLVAAEDIRWMLSLTTHRLKAAYSSYAKGRGLDITPKLYEHNKGLILKMLEGNKSLTRQEIESALVRAGAIQADNEADKHYVKYSIAVAEVEGFVCSGVDKGNKPTYALLDERVPPVRKLHKEEALALLVGRYFKSHSPASLNDFTWWSGLTTSEARQAIGLIEGELIADHFADQKLYVHESFKETAASQEDVLHLLPSFDEFLISYKDRTAVLASEHHPKAFNNFGTFYPVILHKGKIVGNWNKATQKGTLTVETSFFDPKTRISAKLLEKAAKRYLSFWEKQRSAE